MGRGQSQDQPPAPSPPHPSPFPPLPTSKRPPPPTLQPPSPSKRFPDIPGAGWEGIPGHSQIPGGTHRLTACWMTFIQWFRSSREAACTSYISGGAALIRNIPFSWLAMSRTIRFCREMTAGLSCGIGKRWELGMLPRSCGEGREAEGAAHQHGEGVFLVLLLQEHQHVRHQQHQDVWGERG